VEKSGVGVRTFVLFSSVPNIFLRSFIHCTKHITAAAAENLHKVVLKNQHRPKIFDIRGTEKVSRVKKKRAQGLFPPDRGNELKPKDFAEPA
jgi:hypothetical protein